MNKPLLLLLAAFGLATTTHAQSGFRPGYVVTLSGDTLRGEVDNRGASGERPAALYRPNGAGAPTTYPAQQLRAYGLTGGSAYEARTLAGAPAGAEGPALLEVLERGPATLYLLRDAAGREQYYVAQATGPAVLLEKQVEKVTLNAGLADQQVVMREKNLYRGKLAELMADCPDMGLYIAQLPFGEKSLRQAVQRYNTCRGGATQTAQAPARRSAFSLWVGGGLGRLSISSLQGKSAGLAGGFTAGLGFSTPLSRRTTRMSFIAALLYDKGHYRVNNGRVTSFSGSLAQRQYDCDVTQLRLPLGIRYGFNGGALQPFVQLGISNGYTIQYKIDYRDEWYTAPGKFTDWKPLEFAARRYEQSAFCGVGLRTNRPDRRNLAVMVQGDFSNGFSSASTFNTGQQRFYALLTYDLSK